jgi:hypothetical protein
LIIAVMARQLEFGGAHKVGQRAITRRSRTTFRALVIARGTIDLHHAAAGAECTRLPTAMGGPVIRLGVPPMVNVNGRNAPFRPVAQGVPQQQC